MDFSELASSLPTAAVADRGLLGALNGIGVRDASRTTIGEVSASQSLLDAKRSAAFEEAAVAAAPPSERVTAARAAKAAAAQNAASTPAAMLHASLVAGHRANMDEILAQQEEVRLTSGAAELISLLQGCPHRQDSCTPRSLASFKIFLVCLYYY